MAKWNDLNNQTRKVAMLNHAMYMVVQTSQPKIKSIKINKTYRFVHSQINLYKSNLPEKNWGKK
jgi:hypothetical protein